MVVTLPESLDATAYCRKLKQRLKDEDHETVTNCHGLKMKAADEKLPERVTVRHGIKLEIL
jgi:hypothetical protein